MLQWVSCSVVRRRGGRNCFCVWRFWRTVICLADSERLPEGRSLNNLCPGCEGSAVIFPARFLTLEVYRSWMVGRLAPMIFSADLTVRWSLFLSSLVADPNQTVIEVLSVPKPTVQLSGSDSRVMRVHLPGCHSLLCDAISPRCVR